MTATHDKRLAAVAASMSALRAGDRCWFWLCPEAQPLPLMLLPFSDPKGVAKLLRRAAALEVPDGARICVGLAAVSSTGSLMLGSTTLEPSMLDPLAAWVHANVDAHPGLAVLKDTQLVQLGADGQTVARFTEPGLWSGLPGVPCPGTLAHARAVLGGLAAGEEAWVWMSAHSQPPVVLAARVSTDPSGAEFRDAVLGGRRRVDSQDAGLRGLARRMSSGALLVMTRGDIHGIGGPLAAWLAAQGPVHLLQTDGTDEATAARLLGGSGEADLAPLLSLLDAAQAGQRCLFWFTTADAAGAPALHLASSREGLKALAMASGGEGDTARGQLCAASWGLELRLRKPAPGLLAALAGWAGAHAGRWPRLGALIDARATVRDKNNAIVDRHRDDDAWAPLRARRT